RGHPARARQRHQRHGQRNIHGRDHRRFREDYSADVWFTLDESLPTIATMVGYNIFRNDERLCVAGVGDFGVLTACVTWLGRSPERIAHRTAGSSSDKPVELTLHVGGLRSGERDTGLHMRWL